MPPGGRSPKSLAGLEHAPKRALSSNCRPCFGEPGPPEATRADGWFISQQELVGPILLGFEFDGMAGMPRWKHTLLLPWTFGSSASRLAEGDRDGIAFRKFFRGIHTNQRHGTTTLFSGHSKCALGKSWRR